jgi:hypothetical protein
VYQLRSRYVGLALNSGRFPIGAGPSQKCRFCCRSRLPASAKWRKERDPGEASRAVKEYLATLDDAAFGAATEVTPKFVSPSDPAAQWTGAMRGPAFFAMPPGPCGNLGAYACWRR